MKTTLPIPEQKLIVNEKELLSFSETVLLKDFSLNSIKKKVPELSDIIDSLVNLLPTKRIITVDVMKHNFTSKTKTCVDTSFHVDGIGNDYVIWSIGDFRTEFLVETFDLEGLGTLKPHELMKSIEEKSHNVTYMESERAVPFIYDSGCVHRGRVAEAGTKRIMIRICSSDYIKPRNVDLRKALKYKV